MRLILNIAPVETTPVGEVLLVPEFVSQPVAKLVGAAAFGYLLPATFWSNHPIATVDAVLETVSAEVAETSLPAGYAVRIKTVSSHAFGIPVTLIPEMLNFGEVAVFL